MHLLIMLKPMLSNWAAGREEQREAMSTSPRGGSALSAALGPQPSLALAAAPHPC